MSRSAPAAVAEAGRSVQRPAGSPAMHQHWGGLLFMHWPVPAAELRTLVPHGLEIDTFDGTAWVTVTPFTMWGIRPAGLPAAGALSRSHELNVRTYVHRDGVPGVWFLSLDASNPFAVWGARLLFGLPYFRAEQVMPALPGGNGFRSRRTDRSGPPAILHARWTLGDRLPLAQPDTLQYFLVERYALYAERGWRLMRTRIHHAPWQLQEAGLTGLSSTMIESHGLRVPRMPALVAAQAEPLHVEVWRPEAAG